VSGFVVHGTEHLAVAVTSTGVVPSLDPFEDGLGKLPAVLPVVLVEQLEYPWFTKYPERVLRNEFWERWQGREEQLSADPKAISEFKASRASGNSGSTHVDAGQGVGRLTQVRTASDVVSEMCAGAVELLGSWASKANSVERS
jgi:hypothetical protein